MARTIKRGLICALCLAILALMPTTKAEAAVSFIVTGAAGTGVAGYSGNGGPATSAQMDGPSLISYDGAGNLYIAEYDNNAIRKVDTSGNITPVAGGNGVGFSGDGGPATSAQLNLPNGVRVDASGNIYIAEEANRRVRKVDTNGIITTIAGTGVWGCDGNGGPATSANLGTVGDVALDAAGNIYVADSGCNVVRKIDAAGTISAYAGTGVGGYSGDGGPAASAQLNGSNALSFDTAGNLYIAEFRNHAIRRVTPGGTITTVAGGNGTGSSGDNGPATSAQIHQPYAVTMDALNNMYITDSYSHRIRKVDGNGTITTIAGSTQGYSGNGGPALSAQFDTPDGVAVSPSGDLYIADYYNNSVRKVAAIAPASAQTSIGAVVNPTLTFTMSGRAIDCGGATPTAGTSSTGSSVNLGRVSSSATAIAAQDMTVATNAANGFFIEGRYTGALTDGAGHSIASLPGDSWQDATSFPALGTPAFGYRTDWFDPGTWAGFAVYNVDSFLSSSIPVTNAVECVAYRAQAGPTTPAGTYSTTLIYTALARY